MTREDAEAAGGAMVDGLAAGIVSAPRFEPPDVHVDAQSVRHRMSAARSLEIGCAILSAEASEIVHSMRCQGYGDDPHCPGCGL